MFDRRKHEIIDLSLPIENSAVDAWPPRIIRWNHREGARMHGRSIGINPDEFPHGMSQAWEEMTLITHNGTHMDSPWHFYPTSEGKPSKTIDQVPLEWCIGDGVILDLTHKKAGELITKQDLVDSLDRIKYRIKPLDIVLIRTDAYKRYGNLDYMEAHPGMGRESTLYLLDQGVKVMGTDGFGFDKGFRRMAEDFRRGEKDALWPAHNLGEEREYCHLERLANLDKVPVPHGFTVMLFPILIERASAGWVRAVAVVEK